MHIAEWIQNVCYIPSFSFKALHRQDASNLDLFRTCVDDLLDYYLAGFNCCLIVMGESGSGKTHTLAGEGTSKAGLVPTILDAVFARLHAGLYPIFFTSGPFCSTKRQV